jgi:hypothetical protein
MSNPWVKDAFDEDGNIQDVGVTGYLVLSPQLVMRATSQNLGNYLDSRSFIRYAKDRAEAYAHRAELELDYGVKAQMVPIAVQVRGSDILITTQSITDFDTETYPPADESVLQFDSGRWRPTLPDSDITAPASVQYVNTSIADLVNGAPETLDTLNELAAALSDDASFANTVTNSLANKLDLAGGTMTGALKLYGAPVAGLEATTKTYVDDLVSNSIAAIDYSSFALTTDIPDISGLASESYVDTAVGNVQTGISTGIDLFMTGTADGSLSIPVSWTNLPPGRYTLIHWKNSPYIEFAAGDDATGSVTAESVDVGYYHDVTGYTEFTKTSNSTTDWQTITNAEMRYPNSQIISFSDWVSVSVISNAGDVTDIILARVGDL